MWHGEGDAITLSFWTRLRCPESLTSSARDSVRGRTECHVPAEQWSLTLPESILPLLWNEPLALDRVGGN